MIVGLLHPGAMGAAVGDLLRTRGHDVIWASAGRSETTRRLAAAFRDVARHYGIEGPLQAEWSESVPELAGRLARAEHAAAEKGWRFVGEFEEIAQTFAAAGAPDGFHRAAAEVLRG